MLFYPLTISLEIFNLLLLGNFQFLGELKTNLIVLEAPFVVLELLAGFSTTIESIDVVIFQFDDSCGILFAFRPVF